MARVRGSALLTRVAFVREKYGEDGMKRLLPALAAETRLVLAGRVENRTWHPFEAFVDLNVRADALFGRGDHRICYEMGAYGADRNLNTVYKLFFQLSTVSYILGKASALWGEHYDSGRLVVAGDARTSLTMHIEQVDTPSCAHCFSVMGWAARSIELTGASIADQQRTACRHWRESACAMRFRLK